LQFISKITDWSILTAQSCFIEMPLVAKGILQENGFGWTHTCSNLIIDYYKRVNSFFLRLNSCKLCSKTHIPICSCLPATKKKLFRSDTPQGINENYRMTKFLVETMMCYMYINFKHSDFSNFGFLNSNPHRSFPAEQIYRR